MKIVIAPDSFKNCLRSYDVCLAIEHGIKSVLHETNTVLIPMADGGEGTTETFIFATGGKLQKIKVSGPLGAPVEASYGISGDKSIAVMEMASASGIELLQHNQLNPLKTSTYGTGEILKSIINCGIKDIIIGIGGSATVDGGAGMAQALGCEFYDKNDNLIINQITGNDVAKICRIDKTKVDKMVQSCRIRVACDVTNPLLGIRGAAAVFGPQKGADATMVEILEQNLVKYSQVMIDAGYCRNADHPGDGAAGGMGFSLRVLLNATMVSGAELIADITRLDTHLQDADLLITGEGCSDAQTDNGKLCAVVAAHAKRAGVPAVLLSGAVTGNIDKLRKSFAAVFSIANGPCTLQQAIAATADNLTAAAAGIAGLYDAGVNSRNNNCRSVKGYTCKK
jgi:glycerate kinase